AGGPSGRKCIRPLARRAPLKGLIMQRIWILLLILVLLPSCGPSAPSQSEAQVYFANGERALGLGSYQVAIGWLSSAIAAEPKNAAAHRLRAKAYVLKAEGMKPLTGMAAQKTAETPEKVVDNAIADATTAIELDPRDAEAYLLRARAQRRKGGD